MTWSVLQHDALAAPWPIEDESVQCIVTSPPYWGLRDYSLGGGQLGQESTLAEYVARLVSVFEEARRVLRPDGLCWIVLGDCYATRWSGRGGQESSCFTAANGDRGKLQVAQDASGNRGRRFEGLKSGDLVGLPFAVAAALRGAGWYWRSMNVWAKGASFGSWNGNPRPESVETRPTISHEYVLQMSKSETPAYRYEEIREPGSSGPSDLKKMRERRARFGGKSLGNEDALNAASVRTSLGRKRSVGRSDGKRNIRSVWLIPTEPLREKFFAAYPKRLVRPCIEASAAPGDLVMDPFTGSGTTGIVAARMGRSFVGLELNPEHVAISRRRIAAAAAAGVQMEIA